jgi:putative nucleotidyltransferase with HDIG domain
VPLSIELLPSMPSSSATSQPHGSVPGASRELPVPYERLRRQLAWAALAVACLCALFGPFPIHAWRDSALLIGLVIAATLFAVRLPNSSVTTYPSIPIFFALVGLLGASAATLAAIFCVVVDGFVTMPAKRRLKIKLYIPNVSVQVITIGLSALLYVALEHFRFPHSGVRIGETPGWRACLALPICSLVAFMGNALLTTTLVSSYEKKRWDIVWHNNFRWQLPSAVLMSPLGLITAMLYGENCWLGIGFIIVPVYAMRMAILTHERTMAAYRQGVELLGRVMQEAHPYTHGHLHRVARWARKIAEEMHLPPSSMQHIEDAAILHDIGKVAVDDRVLNKVGKLTDEDWSMIRRHPVTGAELVIKMSVLDKVGYWIRHHHERPDGKGYPDGLLGDDIPIESCIISAVDAFDAMVGGPAKEDQRPYRQPMSQDAAVAELRRHAGTQFHAGVIEVFVAILEREQQMEARGQRVGAESEVANDSLWSGSFGTSPGPSLSLLS